MYVRQQIEPTQERVVRFGFVLVKFLLEFRFHQNRDRMHRILSVLDNELTSIAPGIPARHEEPHFDKLRQQGQLRLNGSFDFVLDHSDLLGRQA